MDVATAHVPTSINPITNFVEANGYPCPFDSEKKISFLKLWKSNSLGLYKTCRQLGMSVSTVHHHYKTDMEFKHQYDEVEKDYFDELEAVSRENALVPKMVIERIFQLKNRFPERYGDGQNRQHNDQVVIQVQGDLVINSKKRIESMTQQVDQEVIDASASFESETKETHNNASPDPSQKHADNTIHSESRI